MQRFARAGIDVQVFGLDALHLGESLDEFFLEPVRIPAALWRHIHDGLPCGITRPQRIFVRVDHYGSRMKIRWGRVMPHGRDRKSTRLNSSHGYISYAVFCLKKKKKIQRL